MIRRAPLTRRTPLKRTQWTRKPTVRPGWAQARRERLDLADGWCEALVPNCCTGVAVHVHHRLRRSQGGTDRLGNLLAVCAACHGWIHAHVAESQARGWLVRSGKDAA